MSTLPTPRHFTVSEYLRLADVGVLRPNERVELIDGQIVAMTPRARCTAPSSPGSWPG